MNIQDKFSFLIISYLIQYVLSGKNSLTVSQHLTLQYATEVFPEYYLALQFDCPMFCPNFVPLLRGQSH